MQYYGKVNAYLFKVYRVYARFSNYTPFKLWHPMVVAHFLFSLFLHMEILKLLLTYQKRNRFGGADGLVCADGRAK